MGFLLNIDLIRISPGRSLSFIHHLHFYVFAEIKIHCLVNANHGQKLGTCSLFIYSCALFECIMCYKDFHPLFYDQVAPPDENVAPQRSFGVVNLPYVLHVVTS